jgi:hypothetical protein
VQHSDQVEIQSEDSDLGELIVRKATIELGPCGERDLRLELGEFSSLPSKGINRIVYTFDIANDTDQMEPDYLEEFIYGAVSFDSDKISPKSIDIDNFDAIR